MTKIIGLSLTTLLVVALACSAGRVWSAQTSPSESINISIRNPIASLFGLTRPDLIIHSENTYSVHHQIEVINYFSSTNKANEQLFMDGETWISTLTLAKRWQNYVFDVSLPYLGHSGGSLDSFIYDFHDVLQLPQNGRTQDRTDRRQWFVRKNGEIIVNETNNESGIGDISFGAKTEWLWDSTPVDLQARVKLPSGSYSKQTGSNGIDIGLSAAFGNPNWLKNRSLLAEVPMSFWWGFGVNYVSKNSKLDALAPYPIVLTGRVGFGFSISQSWQLKSQIDTHSPMFDSELREFGWVPLQITFESFHQLDSDHVLR